MLQQHDVVLSNLLSVCLQTDLILEKVLNKGKVICCHVLGRGEALLVSWPALGVWSTEET